MDDATSAFFETQLTHIFAETFDVEYPEYLARALIPVDASVDPGAEIWKYWQYDRVGAAKILAHYAEDSPSVDVLGQEFFGRIRTIAAHYKYSIHDIEAARYAGRPLDAGRAQAARAAIE